MDEELNGEQMNQGQNMNYGMPVEPQRDESQGFGIASMVLGIIALLLFCTCANIPLAIISIVFGIIQLVKSNKKGMAITGIITSGISILLTILLMVFIFAAPMGSGYQEYHEFHEYHDVQTL